MPGDVLLLRSPSEDGGPDKYEEAFHARGYRAVSIPVLETVHTNVEKLATIVRRAGRIEQQARDVQDRRYTGVIVTSGRACEAWRHVVEQLAWEDKGGHEGAGVGTERWSTIPFYTVGQATASALSAIHDAFPSSPYTPKDIRGATESGNSEKLAHFIVADLSSAPSGSKGRRLLYLTGDKNRDTLPSILKDAGIELDNLQVYATQGSSRFEDDLMNALEGVQALDADYDEHWWIVYFAPSSAQHVSPILSKHFDMPAAEKPDAQNAGTLRRARLAAIGPTTSAYLESELHLRVDVVAAQPNPDALVEGIASFDGIEKP
ncbi:tetrapyrrole biosynthesis, uroporphyrinogen III synthase [Lentinus tigrinus ALCF2SS1-6]|uniref:Tetrapyrrole biosynthesis, uroporphyrinogen III synthase n=1 Tax=Lentinus tigrinus ALCF2SS1-6 TaxID=1328759 RepID=A0A5C2RPR7_9APHY|nr:tetrapyrrole biosynthesis, uroporphyrinogen III synthase [Lentinus tigrinus ALCF2SS1-6]